MPRELPEEEHPTNYVISGIDDFNVQPDNQFSYTVGVPDMDIDQRTNSIGLNRWAEFINEDPEIFCSYLMDISLGEADIAVENGIRFLASIQPQGNLSSAQVFLLQIAPFKENPEYADLIAKLEQKVEWLNEVIEYFKSMVEVPEAYDPRGQH